MTWNKLEKMVSRVRLLFRRGLLGKCLIAIQKKRKEHNAPYADSKTNFLVRACVQLRDFVDVLRWLYVFCPKHPFIALAL